MMRIYWKSILATLIVLPLLAGCGKDAPRREESSQTSESGKTAETDEFATKEKSAAWARPFSPTAPPPLAAGPSSPVGLTPTRYADARLGAKALYRITPERGGASQQTIEIVRTDATTAYANQAVETKEFGRFIQYLYYNRFVEASPAVDRFNPANRENYMGDQLVTVGSKKLLCRVYETRNGSSIYRTLMCDGVPGGFVKHSDNAAGVWKTRLQLLDVWE